MEGVYSNRSRFVINLGLWLVLGGMIGWLAGRVLGAKTRERLAFSVAVGMTGAVVGGMLFGGATLSGNLFNEGALMIALASAAIASALAIVLRRGVVQ
jgi:uncharacterized membrane protein YeaQ/YmgE (transglycosylase-associated protein family)